jgi:hypothetical protein
MAPIRRINNPVYHGWDSEHEQQHFQNFLAEAEYSGERWFIPFKEIKDKIYEEAERVQKTDITKQMLVMANYKYKQDASNGCVSVNGANRSLAMTLEIMVRKGKKVTFFRGFEGWTYATYHALVARDYSYGGCTLSGMMTAVNKYGILPYHVFGDVISDEAMVRLGWNRKNVFQAIYEKYSPVAERVQLVTTVPDTFEDLVTLSKAGYVTGYGTDRAVTKGKDGIYRLNGRSTAHSMTVGGMYKEGYLGHANGYGDNIGWIPVTDHYKQWQRRHYSCFTIIDVERLEFKNAKPNLTNVKEVAVS